MVYFLSLETGVHDREYIETGVHDREVNFPANEAKWRVEGLSYLGLIQGREKEIQFLGLRALLP